MQPRLVKTLFILLTLVTMMLGVSLPASAHVSTAAGTSHIQSTQMVKQAALGCPGIKVNNYIWGQEWYLPKPCADALKDGSNVIPVAGQVVSGSIAISEDLSCNGSIYIDIIWPTVLFYAAPTVTPRPAC
jgi:hypothetical protein